MVKAASCPIWERWLWQEHRRRQLPNSAKNKSLSRRMTSTAQAYFLQWLVVGLGAGAKVDIPVAQAFSTSRQAGRGQSIHVANAKNGWQTKCFGPADQVLQTKPCFMRSRYAQWFMAYAVPTTCRLSLNMWLVYSLAWWENKATTKLTKNHRRTDETMIKQTARKHEFPPTCSKPESFTCMLGLPAAWRLTSKLGLV